MPIKTIAALSFMVAATSSAFAQQEPGRIDSGRITKAANLDRRPVQFQVLAVQTVKGQLKIPGVTGPAPAAGTGFLIAVVPQQEQIQQSINQLKAQGLLEVLGNTKITAVPGRESSFQVTGQQATVAVPDAKGAIKSEVRNLGPKISLDPRWLDRQTVRLNLGVVESKLRQFPQYKLPALDESKMVTAIDLKSGQTSIIKGLPGVQTAPKKTSSRFGRLFGRGRTSSIDQKNVSQKEVVLIITPLTANSVTARATTATPKSR